MILTAKKNKKLAALVLIAAAGLGAELGSSIGSNSSQIDTIRSAAVKACQNSLKPGGVRFILAQQIEQQIQQSSSFDYSQFFPNVPPKVLHKLIGQQVQQEREEIAQLRGIDCEAQYR